MHKIRCPHCAAVNLEAFITYPQCAGCGQTLPQPSQSDLPFWQRPVRPVLWLVIVGGALGGLLLAASLLRVPSEDASQIVLIGDRTRRSRVGAVISLNLRVDALGETRSQRRQPLREVKLRMPLRTFDSVRFVSLEPMPDEMGIQGNSRYFTYASMDRETELRLRLRVTRAGLRRLPITIYAADRLPGNWRIALQVSHSPRPLQTPTAKLAPHARN